MLNKSYKIPQGEQTMNTNDPSANLQQYSVALIQNSIRKMDKDIATRLTFAAISLNVEHFIKAFESACYEQELRKQNNSDQPPVNFNSSENSKYYQETLKYLDPYVAMQQQQQQQETEQSQQEYAQAYESEKPAENDQYTYEDQQQSPQTVDDVLNYAKNILGDQNVSVEVDDSYDPFGVYSDSSNHNEEDDHNNGNN